MRPITAIFLLALLPSCSPAPKPGPAVVGQNVRDFGAVGDGKSIDSPAINRTIDAVANAGGGTVYFPAGTYRCFSVHLKSNIQLYLDAGATIMAAPTPRDGSASYDPPEDNQWDQYEDFGHSHWQNSLIWGEALDNVSIVGPGRIDGLGLSDGKTSHRGESAKPAGKFGYPGTDTLPAGVANKAISLKQCRNVTLRDFTIFRGGHFGVLATGVDGCTIENLKIDTNRDGIDLDCCRNVRMSNCAVNSPNDDAICPKSSFALGQSRPCENMTISNCQVSGWEMGSLLDGSSRPRAKGPGMGRIKLGTESNGGFKNITISNCTFDTCWGLALESVDGAQIEDVSISNITMRNIAFGPIFLRLGARLRGPDGTEVGTICRVSISNVECYNAGGCSIVSGVPGHDIQDITLTNIHIHAAGAGTADQAMVDVPEKESDYPDPNMFGTLPAYGFFVRHARGILMRDVDVSFIKPDARPALIFSDVSDLALRHVAAQGRRLSLHYVTDFTARDCPGIEDLARQRVADQQY